MSDTAVAQTLGPEPWGRRLARARALSRSSAEEVGRRLKPLLTAPTVRAVERQTGVPRHRRLRGMAAVLVVFYGFELQDFELAPEDLPPALDLDALRALGSASTTWYSDTPTESGVS